MKTAIKATSIAFIIFSAIMLVTFGILGAVFLAADQAFVDGMTVVNNGVVVTGQEALDTIHLMGGVFLGVGLPMLVGIVLDIVLLVLSGKRDVSGGLLIGFGVAATAFGQYAPGILSIVYGAKNLHK